MATRWLSIACDWNIIFKMKFFYLLWLLHIYVSDGLRISCGTRGAGTNIVFPDTDLRELRCVCSDPNSGDILEKYWLIIINCSINCFAVQPEPSEQRDSVLCSTLSSLPSPPAAARSPTVSATSSSATVATRTSTWSSTSKISALALLGWQTSALRTSTSWVWSWGEGKTVFQLKTPFSRHILGAWLSPRQTWSLPTSWIRRSGGACLTSPARSRCSSGRRGASRAPSLLTGQTSSPLSASWTSRTWPTSRWPPPTSGRWSLWRSEGADCPASATTRWTRISTGETWSAARRNSSTGAPGEDRTHYFTCRER